jgi:leucyl aminopeptidase
MIPEFIVVADVLPTAHLTTDDLLIVIGPASGPHASWVDQLVAKSAASMSRSTHYLQHAVGFLAEGGRAPFVVLTWDHPGVSALERRWVLHQALKPLLKQFNNKKIVVFLEKGCGADGQAMAEDVLTRSMSPRYERSHLSYLKILSPDPLFQRSIDPAGHSRLRGQLGYRSWLNENPDSLTSIEMGKRLDEFCRKHQCGFEVFDVDKLKQLGMNLLLAVGQASERSPSRMFIATHRLKNGVKPLMLVGKGITFDTGGINLKPHESFVNCMKNDMGGAGLMGQLFMSLVESGYQEPLILVIPACENLIGEGAMKPGAIIRSYAGKDVIIEHTDAEGRLILADALNYAQKQFNPALTLMAATLTTASLRQFTNFFTPVHFANKRFSDALSASASKWGEEFVYWGEFLPFLQGNKSSAADLTNMGRMPSHASMGGGSNVAAHFLKEFAVSPLVHLDIFAAAWNWSGDYPGAHYGATGAPFNSLFDCLLAEGQRVDLFGYR